MSATVTRLDDHRPSFTRRLTAAFRTWWSGLSDLPEPELPPFVATLADYKPVRVQKPLNWPLGIGQNFDEYLFQTAAERQLILRTRDGHRVLLDRLDKDGYVEWLHGRIELPDGCEGALQWRGLSWATDGRFAAGDHKWDLVSLETASCICCDKHDIDMSEGVDWYWITVDRAKGLGVCNRCDGEEAA